MPGPGRVGTCPILVWRSMSRKEICRLQGVLSGVFAGDETSFWTWNDFSVILTLPPLSLFFGESSALVSWVVCRSRASLSPVRVFYLSLGYSAKSRSPSWASSSSFRVWFLTCPLGALIFIRAGSVIRPGK